MTDWPVFAGFTGVVLASLLLLARASQALFDDGGDADGRTAAPVRSPLESPDRRPADPAGGADGRPAGEPPAEPVDGEPTTAVPADTSPANAPHGPGTLGDSVAAPDAHVDRPSGPDEVGDDPSADSPVPRQRPGPGLARPPTPVLLANVAVSQGVLATLLLAGAWYAGVPAAALGAGPAALAPDALAAGIGLGLALYAANEVAAAAGRRAGFGGGEELRAALAPETPAGWAALLLVVLPIVAGFEELLFRGALIGAMHAGFGVSPWLLAAASSVAFAAGHGAQGPVGIVVTGTLGFVLAAAFVVTGSLLTVFVAHYLVNALEFLVHELAGIDPVAAVLCRDR